MNETIGSRIQKIRVKKNLTIRELCNLTKIDEVSLSTYESGIIEPSVRENSNNIKSIKCNIRLYIRTYR